MATPDVWRLRAASVAGGSHISAGLGGDDAFAYAVSPDGDGVVAVVADGAGSRSGTSAHGSFAACRAVLARADVLLSAGSAAATAEVAVREAFHAARAAVAARAAELRRDIRDLATTLAVAVVTSETCVVGQIGDGIVVCETDGVPVSLVPEIKGEYANEVVFLTTDAIEDEVRIRRVESPVRRFALSTDGLRYKVLRLQDGGVPFEPFFESMWRAVEEDSGTDVELGDWLARLDDQTGDDKTLIIGARVPSTTGSDTPGAASPEPASLPDPPPSDATTAAPRPATEEVA